MTGPHPVTPRLRSIHRAVDGIPVSGIDVEDYPLNAVCLECGSVITCRNYLGEWRHLD